MKGFIKLTMHLFLFAFIATTGTVIMNQVSTNIINSDSGIQGPAGKVASDINTACDDETRVTGNIQLSGSMTISGSSLEFNGEGEPVTKQLNCEAQNGGVDGWNGGGYEIEYSNGRFNFNTQ